MPAPGPSRARRLRELLGAGPIVVAPGAYDGLTARFVERAGFPAVYATGGGISYSVLGQPDLGLVSFTEMLERIGEIARAVAVPVIADADTGYGGPLNVIRAVRAYEQAGVSAIQIEDQAFPKRCGHMARKELIAVEEMAAKIEAACWARADPDTVIIGRTDARGVEGLEAAVKRALRYAEAGAELLFVEAPESPAELTRIARALPAPCMANMVEGGRTPLTPAADLERMGYRLVIFPNLTTRVMAKAALDALAVLRREGDSTSLLPHLLPFPELNAFLGLRELTDLAERFTPKDGRG